MREFLKLNRLAYFAAVAETGSFTAAAERLGVGKAVVSQHIARLEQAVGTTLLVRTTRKVRLSEAGRRLQARATLILQEAGDAFDELAAGSERPTGTLRLTAPIDYGTSRVIPIATRFRGLYPQCAVELRLTDQTLDLGSGNLDLAIRAGWLTDSRLQARRFGSFEQVLVCAASMTGRLPKAPSQLGELPFVANAALREPLALRLSRARNTQTVRLAAALTVDATIAAHAAVRAGAGFAVLPGFLVADDIAAGRLVRLLPGWSLPQGGIHVVYPPSRFRPARVREFVALLVTAARAERHLHC